MRITKSSKNIYSSIDRKVKNIYFQPENDQNSYVQQIEKIFKEHKIDENDQEILFQNELFRKLLKGLNEILDEKILKKTTKLQIEKLTEKPDVSNEINLNKEIEKNQTVIKRQNKELQKLESRVSQLEDGIYLQNLENDLKEIKKNLEMKKKEKRNQFDSTKLNAKCLEDIVEIKGMPENLQKSSVIDSDLCIFMIKNKNLKKKLEKNCDEFELLEKKLEKIEGDFIVSMKEAYDLKISFEINVHKSNYEKLNAKINRFKQCIQQVNSTNKNFVKKSEVENEVMKVKLQEMESKVTEKNLALSEIRQKLSKVLSSDNIDKNVKGILDLFAAPTQNYSEASATSSLKVAAQSDSLKNYEDLNKNHDEPNEFTKEIIHNSQEKITSKKGAQIDQKNEKVDKFEKEENEKEITVKSDEFDGKERLNENFKLEDSEKKLENEKNNFDSVLNNDDPSEKNSEKPIKTLEEPFKEQFKDFNKPENQNEDSFEIKKKIPEIEKNDYDANKTDQENDKLDNNKNEVRTELSNSKDLKSKPLKKINDEGLFFICTNTKKLLNFKGCGTLTISPHSFRSLNDEHLQMIFCRVKIGNRAYNTKISGEKEHKPSWDENIEIRKLEEEHKFVIQIWNLDPKNQEQLIGETILELNSKEMDIYSKKLLSNNFGIYDNGVKKGDLLMEISWLEDEIKKII